MLSHFPPSPFIPKNCARAATVYTAGLASSYTRDGPPSPFTSNVTLKVPPFSFSFSSCCCKEKGLGEICGKSINVQLGVGHGIIFVCLKANYTTLDKAQCTIILHNAVCPPHVHLPASTHTIHHSILHPPFLSEYKQPPGVSL